MTGSLQAPPPPEARRVYLAPFGLSPVTRSPNPPRPTQARTFAWARERLRSTSGGIPVLYVQHGVRSGGTRAILNILLARLFTEPGIRVLVARKEYADLRASVMETVFEIIPPQQIVSRNEQEHRYVVQGTGGPSTLFCSGVKDVVSKGSQEFGCISVHEAQEIGLFDYRYLKNRCSQAGHRPMFLLEGNAPTDGHWLTRVSDPRDREYDPDLTVVVLSTEENKEALDPAYWQSLASMPAEWRRRYLLGLTGPLPSGHPVYPAFAESMHVRETCLIPDRPILRFLDFGFRRAACLWAQRSDEGHLLIHREWMALETPEDAFIEGVVQRSNLWFGSRMTLDYGDPAATQRDPQGISTLRRLREHGIRLQYRQTTYADRIPLVNRKLSELIRGEPAVRIHPLCTVLIEGLAGGYHFQDMQEGQEWSEKRQLPVKDGWHDHLANCLEYGMVNLFLHAAPDTLAVHRGVQLRHRERLAGRVGVVSF